MSSNFLFKFLAKLIDPKTSKGSFVYSDISSPILLSKDMNSFIYLKTVSSLLTFLKFF